MEFNGFMPTHLHTIAVLGPESSGKTTLCAQLAAHLRCPWAQEYARSYAPAQAGVYTPADLLAILAGQSALNHTALAQAQAHGDAYVIFDTEAIVLAVWAQLSFGAVPPEIERACAEQTFSHYLLLSPDLPWQADPLRSAPELAQRQRIFALYEWWLQRYHRAYSIIQGAGEQRLHAALEALKQSHAFPPKSAPF